MGFFNNSVIYPCAKTTSPDGMGGFISGYAKMEAHKVEAQPISEDDIKQLWGNNITSRIQIIDDVNPLYLQVNDILVYNNITYEVEQIIPWDDYSIYAIRSKKVNLI